MQTGDLPLASVFAGRYLIERRLGQGGWGTVYYARDQKHDRPVAIKVLHPELAAALGPDRFLREISIAAHLSHSHILPLHDSGETDGLLWYVMPFVDGESLRERLTRERQLPIEDALRLTCQVAAALDYAHRHNVVHRDIKPENILLQDGDAIVADFGIARALGAAGDERLTGTGLVLGTPAYMSPEQAGGDAVVDGRSDLYSLACVLYELLTGEPPFTGATAAAVAARRLSGSVPRVHVVRPMIAPAVERALDKALANVAADRFRTAGEFREALAACASGASEAPVLAPKDTRTRRPASPLRYVTKRATLGALVLIALVAGAVRFVNPRSGDRGAPPGSPMRTLAVLPIADVSPGGDYAHLAEGLTDAIIGELTRTNELRVISRASVMRYAGAGGGMSGSMPGGMAYMDEGAVPPATMASGNAGGGKSPMGSMGPAKSLAEVARELKADVVMQATLARETDSVRISAALVDPSTGRRLWTGAYVRHLRDLFSLQQELSAAVAGILGGRHSPAAAPSAPRRANPAAHDAYLKAVYYQAHWRLADAIAAFEKSVALDGGFAPAYAGMARAYYFSAFFGDMAPGVALGRMQFAAGMALERDSLLAEAHAQMALVKMLHEWNWSAAEQSFRRALELSPNDAQIRHDYAHFLLALGRRQESLEQTEEAVSLDPANPMLLSCMGWHSLFDRQYARAHAYASEANSMMPDFWAQVVRGWAYKGEAKPDSAILALREAARLSPSAFAAAALGHGLAASGHVAEARRILRELLARHEHEYVSSYDIATVYAGLRDEDESFKWLRRAADERSTFLVHLGWDARFEGLRQDPRYRELMVERLALPTPVSAVALAPAAPTHPWPAPN
ncbi:MAG TPA: protein kinase [Gemmatimonadales bacterium]|nr:protein kinase [Gemmatimonadales bacterium]